MRIRLNKRAIVLMETMSLIISIVFLVTILYFFISKGVAGPVKGQTSELVCTFSSYSRGLLVSSLSGFLNTFETTMRGTFGALGAVTGFVAGSVAGFVVAGPIGLVAGAAGGAAAGGAVGFVDSEPIVDSFSLQFLSSIPLVCPTSTENVGLPDKTETPAILADKLGTKLFDAWRAMGQGAYDPLVGLDPPNPRTIFILETHLNQQTDFDLLINMILQKHPNDWPFGNDVDSKRLYLYCQGRSSYGDCKFQDARIYIMYKDDHNYDKWTAGTSICGGNINNDAKEYKSRAQGNPTDLQVTQIDVLDYRTFLKSDSPWYHERDALVVCVENIGEAQ